MTLKKENCKNGLILCANPNYLLQLNLEQAVKQFLIKNLHLVVINPYDLNITLDIGAVKEKITCRYLDINYTLYNKLRRKWDLILLIVDKDSRHFFSRLEILLFMLPAKTKWIIDGTQIKKFPDNTFYKLISVKFIKLILRILFSGFYLSLLTFFILPKVLCLKIKNPRVPAFRRTILVTKALWKRYQKTWKEFRALNELGTLLPLEFFVWTEFLFANRRSFNCCLVPRRILFIRLDHLGDVVNSTPALKLLKKQWPETQITLAVGKWTKDLLNNCPYVDELLIYPTNNRWHLRGNKDWFTFLKQFWIFLKLRRQHYDLAIDPCGWPDTYKLLYMSGAKVKVINDYGRWDFIYNVMRKKVPDDDSRGLPERERVLNLLKIMGLKNTEGVLPELWLSSMEEKYALEFFKKVIPNGTTVIAGIHLGASKPLKRWPTERFAFLVEKLYRAYKCLILIFAGPGEEELIEQFSKHVKVANYVPVVGQNLREFMAIVSKCHLFICNDSGPMHIAVALKVPTVAIFGPGGVARWAPPSPPHVVIRNPNISCSPCSQISCRDNICLKSISVDQVWEGVEKLIKQNKVADRENPPS